MVRSSWRGTAKGVLLVHLLKLGVVMMPGEDLSVHLAVGASNHLLEPAGLILAAKCSFRGIAHQVVIQEGVPKLMPTQEVEGLGGDSVSRTM